jgi:predicted proteasome-type protease
MFKVGDILKCITYIANGVTTNESGEATELKNNIDKQFVVRQVLAGNDGGQMLLQIYPDGDYIGYWPAYYFNLITS